MYISTTLNREIDRWYKLKEHVVQLKLIRDKVRFKLVPAGRRSGKTERAKRYVVKQAMKNPGKRYFVAAPTRDQVKKIYWDDLKKLSLRTLQRKAPSESDLIIYFNNGAEIHLIGLDKPQRIEGIIWAGGIIDEIADCKEDAWDLNIKPALDTFDPTDPTYRAWCWLIGVPDGMNHYYRLVQYAMTSGDPDWAVYHWLSADILPEDVIAAAKRSMSKKQYKQEYEASFETSGGRIYEDYGKDNWTTATIEPHEQLMWHHDFNYTPMSSGIAVVRQQVLTKAQRAQGMVPRKQLMILDEIILESAVARQSAEEFCEKFKDHKNRHVLIYGDPAGRAGEKHGHESDYTEIEKVLRKNRWTYERRVKPAAPSIRDRQNSVRALICNAAGERDLFVNPKLAPYANEGLATVQMKKGSTFLEEEGKYQHITTAIGYMVEHEYPMANRMTTAATTGH